MSTPKTFGKHYVADFFGCDPELLKNVEPIEAILLRAVRECGATLVGDTFHQFQPFGVSGVVLIAESHFAIHTWPEDAFVGLDIFTCGERMDPEKAVRILEKELRATRVDLKIMIRGQLAVP